jgi:hypothetical protein
MGCDEVKDWPQKNARNRKRKDTKEKELNEFFASLCGFCGQLIR